MASTASKLSMRLLIDTKTEKVIFAEASKPVVDFIFNMLCLPIEYMHSEQSKEILLNPIASISFEEFCNLLPTKDEDDIPLFSSSELSDFILVINKEDKDYDKERDGDNEEEDDDYYYVEEGDYWSDGYFSITNSVTKSKFSSSDDEKSDYYNEEEGYDNEDGENGDDYYYEEHANYNEDDGDGVYYDDEEGYGYEDGDNGFDYYNEEYVHYNEDGDDGVYFDEKEGYGYEDGENGYKNVENDGYFKEEGYGYGGGDENDYYEEQVKKLLRAPLLYQCPNNCSRIVTTIETPVCYQCNIPMKEITEYCELNTKDIAEENISINNGFVKDKETFIVTDDLVCQPLTSIIENVNKFNINIKDTREMIVELGISEGIKLLMASLELKTVLTCVFVSEEY